MQTKNGFSLIEILIVIVIISITITFATLSMGDLGESRRIILAEEQFKADIKRLQQAAILDATPFGIILYRQGYTLVQYENHWRPTHAFKAFPKQADVTWYIPEPIPHPNTMIPNIIIAPSGDVSDFQLIWKNKQGKTIAITQYPESTIINNETGNEPNK